VELFVEALRLHVIGDLEGLKGVRTLRMKNVATKA